MVLFNNQSLGCKMKKRNDVILIANWRAGFSIEKWSSVVKWALRVGLNSKYILSDVRELSLGRTELDPAARLILIYGGDGTLFYILNFLARSGRLEAAADPEESLLLVPIGGGTMKRLSRYTRWIDEPVENAKKALKFYDRLYCPPLPLRLLSIKWGEENYVGCTCLTGPIVKLMKEYSRFKTTPVLAALFSAAALGAGLADWPPFLTRLYDQFEGRITVDGQELADRSFLGTLADTMDTAIFGMAPYRGKRGRREFHCLAYAINYKELVHNFPRLAIGYPPSLPEYFNQPVKELTVEPSGQLDFTIDGEFFTLPAGTKMTIASGPRATILANPTPLIPLVSPLASRASSALEQVIELGGFFWPKKQPPAD